MFKFHGESHGEPHPDPPLGEGELNYRLPMGGDVFKFQLRRICNPTAFDIRICNPLNSYHAQADLKSE